ncbi:uncharacterized protein LOC143463390 [Clavelina lepadiformis]|uniref:uncharacterized protein LOC143463390 n=1 Tax=Clavelina lepadiformis TaxID=159417 RepID=UPI004040F681
MDGQDKLILLTPGAFHQLNCDDTPLSDRNNLARFLWKHSSTPNIEQSLLTWLTSTLSTTYSTNYKFSDAYSALWKTLADALNSERISVYLNSNAQDIFIKSSFIKVCIDALSTDTCEETLIDIIDVGRCLVNHKKISSDLRQQFVSLLKFISALLKMLEKLICAPSTTLVSKCICFAKEILLKLEVLLHSHNHPGKAFSNFVEYCFLSCLQLHISLTKNVNFNDEEFINLLETVMKAGLFARKNADLFSKGVKGISGSNSNSGKHRKAAQTTAKFWSQIENLVKTEENPDLIETVYKLFLDAYKKFDVMTKFYFFMRILSFLSIENSSTNIQLLSSLLKLNLYHEVHERGLESQFGKEQKDCYSMLLQKLMGRKCSALWSSCVAIIAKLEHSLIENNVKEILIKIFGQISSACDVDDNELKWLPNIFDSLAEVFQSIRQPLVLLNHFLDSLCECCSDGPTGFTKMSFISISKLFSVAFTSNCITVCPHNTTLDIWDAISAKLTLCFPESKQHSAFGTISVGPKKGKKHKLISEEVISSKKLKTELDSNTLKYCLIVLLCRVVDESPLLGIYQQISARQKLYRLLEDQCQLVEYLHDFVKNKETSLVGPLYQLMVVRGQCEMVFQRYCIKGHSDDFPQFDVISKLSELESLRDGQLSFSAKFYLRKLLCFKLEWLCWQLMNRTVLNQEEDDLLKQVQSLMCSLVQYLNCDESSISLCEWNGAPETINSNEKLNIASLHLILNYSDLFLTTGSEEVYSSIAKMILKSNPSVTTEKVMKPTVFLSNAPILKSFLQTSNFLECRNLHFCILRHLTSSIQDKIKELEKNKQKPLTEILSLVQRTLDEQCDYEHKQMPNVIKKIIGMATKFSNKPLKEITMKSISILSCIPVSGLCKRDATAMTMLLLCNLYVLHVNVNAKLQCICMLDHITSGARNWNIFYVLPFNFFVSFVTEELDCCSEAEYQASLKRILGSLMKFHIFNMTEETKNLIDKVCSSFDNEEPKEANLTIQTFTILLENCSSMILKQLKPSGVSKYVYAQDAFNGSYTITKTLSTSYLDPKKQHLKVLLKKGKSVNESSGREKVLHYSIKVLEKIIKVATKTLYKTEVLKTNPELVKSCFLANFALDVLDNVNADYSHIKEFLDHIDMSAIIQNFSKDLHESISNLHWHTASLQLILLYFELQVYLQQKNVSDVVNLSSSVRKEVLLSLINSSSSSVISSSPYMSMLLDRIIVVNMWLLSSLEDTKDVFITNVKRFQQATHVEVIMSQLKFIHLLTACYDPKSRKFESVPPVEQIPEHESNQENDETKFSNPVHFEHVKFLRDSLDAAVNHLERSTQGFPLLQISNDDVVLFPLVLSTIAEIINLGPGVIKTRQVPVTFSAIFRMDFHHIYSAHSDQFCKVVLSTCDVLNSVLNQHKMAVPGIVPHILSACRKLLICIMHVAGKISNGRNYQQSLSLSEVEDCARQLERICLNISSNYASYFKRCVAYIVADYAHGLTVNLIHLSVKKPLQTSMYYLVSLCDEHSVAMLKTTLRPGVRDVFRKFYQDYVKYFKYTGRV